jgi:hypothetical protein
MAAYDQTNIPLGLNIPTQIPLNVKEYAESEAILSNTINGILPFQYHKYLIVHCLLENTFWEWNEVPIGLENTGLINQDFTYPADHIAFEINYSNKAYNFFKKESDSSQNNYVRQLFIYSDGLPVNYTEQDICNYILLLPANQRTILPTDSKWNVIILGPIS